MLNQYEQDAKYNEELSRTQVSLCNIINKYKLREDCINDILKEFAKTGYTVVVSDVFIEATSTSPVQFCTVFDLYKGEP
jgi:hypothetical protein